MEQTRLDQVVAALKSKGVNRSCPRCGHVKFSVIGETHVTLQPSPGVLTVGGGSIPSILVACDNCGYMTQHASVPLGLAPGGTP